MKHVLPGIIDKKSRLLFAGVGNVLRSDDGVGVYICNHINHHEKYIVCTVELGLENYVGKINSYHSPLVILIDSVNFNKTPGYCELLELKNVLDFTVNTHTISLQTIARFITSEIMLLGIQPGNTRFGERLSPEVQRAANDIIGEINAHI